MSNGIACTILRKKQCHLHYGYFYVLLTIILHIFKVAVVSKTSSQLELYFRTDAYLLIIFGAILVTPILYIILLLFFTKLTLIIAAVTGPFTVIIYLTLYHFELEEISALWMMFSFFFSFVDYPEIDVAAFLLRKGAIQILSNALIVYISITICTSLFASHIFYFLCADLSPLKSDISHIPIYMLMFALFAVQTYLTYYLLLNFSCYFISSCIVYNILEKSEPSYSPIHILSLYNVFHNLNGLFYSIFVPKFYSIPRIRNNSACTTEIIHQIQFLLNNTAQLYSRRKAWDIVAMSFYQTCECKGIQNRSIRENFLYKHKSPLYYLINLRFVLFGSSLLLFSTFYNFQLSTYNYSAENILGAAFIVCMVYFMSALCCYTFDTAYRAYVLMYLVLPEQLRAYDANGYYLLSENLDFRQR